MAVVALICAFALAWADGQDRLPLGLPPLRIPAANPLTPTKVELGRALFFEPGLSLDGSVSCASCHLPSLAFADSSSMSKGINGYLGQRNAPTILNAAYAPKLMWDGRSLSLEDQAIYPLMHPREMRSTPQRAVDFLAMQPSYRARFAAAFGDDVVTWERVAQSVASFERTLLSGDSPFDRYMAGDESALPEPARRGFGLFGGVAGCSVCHSYTREQPFFSDYQFHNNGLAWGATPDLGRYEISKERRDKGAFRTPGLRNVARTAPYMHDGRMASLLEVIDFYDRGGDGNPFTDERIRPLHLSARDKLDLLAFLESLSGSEPYGASLLCEKACAR